MHSDQIEQTWRMSLVSKLQERFGLAEEEARKKADMWLQWLRKQPRILMTPEVPEKRVRRARVCLSVPARRDQGPASLNNHGCETLKPRSIFCGHADHTWLLAEPNSLG
jgi:hypothetical protein